MRTEQKKSALQIDLAFVQHMAAIMIIGHLHNIISRTQHEKLCALVAIFNLQLPHWTTLFKNKASVCETLNIKLNDSINILSLVIFLIFGQYILTHTDTFLFWTSTSYLNLRNDVRNSQWKFECKWCPFQEKISISMSLPNCSMELWLYLFSSIDFMGNCMQNASDLELLNMSLGKTSNFGFHILFHTIRIKIFQNGFPLADLFANGIWGEGRISPFIWNQIKFPYFWRVKANGQGIFPNNGTNTYHTTAHLQACHLLKPIKNKIVTFCQHLKRLDDFITKSFVGYDICLNQEVLVMTAVFCFLGDSPKHAEVTNTPNPGV
ncbi:hypothetical protein VP01_1377g4 [Puccinia sorghi]|uniref:Uncharacterized protein n=1 Tax=Puccinia sorghi TaxID=27349 RepID=A0A0L6VLP1_9BASI|nr:hypothetical protein VP01_1377g4 [Puccinia sorghi]